MNLIEKCSCDNLFTGRELDVAAFTAFELAFLAGTGKVHIHTPFTYRLKGIQRVAKVPPFWPEAILLSKVLKTEWKKASESLFTELKKVFSGPELDLVAWDTAQKLMSSAGAVFSINIQSKVHAILGTLLDKGRNHFQNQADGILKKKGIQKEVLNVTYNQWESWLQKATQDQLSAFAEKYPDRILHPQILKQVSDIQANPSQYTETARVDAFDKMVRLSEKDYYWDVLGGTQASFLWQAEGLFMAEDNSISHYQVANPWDQFTCPVCKRLYGVIYDVKSAKAQVMKMSSLVDPDELKSLFPFPRTADVDRATADEIRQAGFLVPPYHGRCRCEINYVWSDEAVSIAPPQMAPPTPVPEKGLKVFIGDTIRAQKYETVYDTFQGMKASEVIDFWKNTKSLGKPQQINIESVSKAATIAHDGAENKYLQLMVKTSEGSKGQILFGETWEASKDAEGIIKEASNIAKNITNQTWIEARATAQAFMDASEDYKTKKTLYRWLPGEDTKKAIDKAVVEGKSFLTTNQEPLSFWTDKLDDVARIQETKGGVIFKRQFMNTDIVIPPELLGVDNRYMVRNIVGSTKFNFANNVQVEVAAEGWNPVGNPIKPLLTTEVLLEEIVMPKGYVKLENMIAFEKQTPFKDIEEAQIWVKENFSENIDNLTKAQLPKFNAAVEQLRTVTEYAPLKEPISLTELKSRGIKGGALGDYHGTTYSATTNFVERGTSHSPIVAGSRLRLDTRLSASSRFDPITQVEIIKNQIKSFEEEISAIQEKLKDPPSWLDVTNHKDYLSSYEEKLVLAEKKLKALESGEVLERFFSKNQFTIAEASSDTQIGGIAIHEYGHAWHDSYATEVYDYFSDKGLVKLKFGRTNMTKMRIPVRGNSDLERYILTEYSKTNFNELFTENFSAYVHGMVEHMHPDMVKFFDKMIPDLDFGHKLIPDIYKVKEL